MAETHTTTAADTAPAGPVLTSFQAHLAAEEAHESPAPAATPVPAQATEAAEAAPARTPEQEADSAKPDADVSDAARTLRKNRAEARKARIQADIDALKREEYEIRDRIARARADEAERAATGRPQPAAVAEDPTDPAPQESDFESYGDFVDARARHAARQELRAHQTEYQTTRARVEREQRAQTLHGLVEKGRSLYADFDAVLEPLGQALQSNPRDEDLSAFIAGSPVGEQVLYQIATNAQVRELVLRAPRSADLHRVLTRVELSLLPRKPAADKPITSAPAPPVHTVGGHASTQALSSRPASSTREHFEREEAEIAERRRLGHRY